MPHKLRLLLTLILFGSARVLLAQPLAEGFGAHDFELKAPPVYITGVTHHIELTCIDADKLSAYGGVLPIVVNGKRVMATFVDGVAQVPVVFDRKEPLSVKIDNFVHVDIVTPMPLWWSIVPPLLVIFMALVFKEVVGSLLLGIFAGSMILGYYATGGVGLIVGFFRAMDLYLVNALFDKGHISVVLFSTAIGGIVALVSKNGGMQALVNTISRKANTPRSGQMATWFLGIAIFFDDYANTLVVGNTMRSLTDKLRISREKLAYIVDSTAAPVAAIALITTWIGAELGYIEGALATIEARGGEAINMGAYAVFLHSLEYAYYPIFALVFIVMLVMLGRDYGPMYHAEVRARLGHDPGSDGVDEDHSDEFAPVPGAPLRKFNALVPVGIVIFGTIAGLVVTGYDAEVWGDTAMGFGHKLSITIGNSDSYQSLIWASMTGLIAAVLLTASQGIMTYSKTIDTAIDGFKTMVNAVVILLLAWALAALTEQMHTADYLAGLAGDTVAPWAVPALTFLLAAVVSFSTGSAWGTMAIVYPLMLPLSWELSLQSGIEAPAALALFFNVTSAVLAGAVLGDHCSPISDTTILSSLATRCDHIAHVRTQLPYALTTGAVALLFTVVSATLGLPWYLNFALGFALLLAVVRVVGRRVDGGV